MDCRKERASDTSKLGRRCALSLCSQPPKGFGAQTLLRIAKVAPKLSDLSHLSSEDLQEQLGPTLGKVLFQNLHPASDKWLGTLERAKRELHQHLKQNIFPIAITSNLYPLLLKLIPDPPPILYAKGNIPLLAITNAVAIVGTREPTQGGLAVARYLASQLTRRNYTIISGLAKGIDRAAHEGALSVHGKTIAVFGTPLDTIYPLEHRSLATCILAESGVIVSELALGQRGFRTAFVRRDRIQSGLSLAVLPIQTRNEGGTMHTVHFARTQNRLVVCPEPLPPEAHALQYEGIKTLINEGKEKTPSFIPQNVNYSELLSLFQQKLHDLLSDQEDGQKSSGEPFSHLESTYASSPASNTANVAEPPAPYQQKQLNAAVSENTQPSLMHPALPPAQQMLPATRETWAPSLPPQPADTSTEPFVGTGEQGTFGFIWRSCVITGQHLDAKQTCEKVKDNQD